MLYSMVFVLYNEDFHKLYPSPNIITMITSRRTRWAGYRARMGEQREGATRGTYK
jgi:hypothetical protein